MAEVLLYERPIPLNRDRHLDLRLKPLEGAAFAANVHSVPLAGAEFPFAARDLPIVFGGDSVEDAAPIALLGLHQSENVFVDADGVWESGIYVPAFIRRYPFVLAEKPDAAGGDDFTVCLDEACTGFAEGDGERLFNEDGTDTEALKTAVRFLTEFQQQVTRTRAFTARLRELDLLLARTIHVQEEGRNLAINGVFVVDEDKLRALDANVAGQLLKDGSLGWIYSHLLSLSNIDRLKARTDKRRQAITGRE